MSAGTAMGIDLALVSTGVGNAQLPIGFIHTVPANTDGEGEKTFIYISTTISTVNANLGLARVDATYGNLILSVQTDDEKLVGVAVNDMRDATLGVPVGTIRFGFAQRTGVATVTGGAVTAGDTVNTDNAGDMRINIAPAVGTIGVGNGVGANLANLSCQG